MQHLLGNLHTMPKHFTLAQCLHACHAPQIGRLPMTRSAQVCLVLHTLQLNPSITTVEELYFNKVICTHLSFGNANSIMDVWQRVLQASHAQPLATEILVGVQDVITGMEVHLHELFEFLMAAVQDAMDNTGSTRIAKWVKESVGVSQQLQDKYRARASMCPTILCFCCQQLWFADGIATVPVRRISSCMIDALTETVQHVTSTFPAFCPPETDIRKAWQLCSTCRTCIKQQQIPRLCRANNVRWHDVHPAVKSLSHLEETLVAIILPFVKIVPLVGINQQRFKGGVVSILADLDRLPNTFLPLRPDSSALVPVHLKLRLTHNCQ
jgi:hypothetical protein